MPVLPVLPVLPSIHQLEPYLFTLQPPPTLIPVKHLLHSTITPINFHH